jgi:hypothetical protein
MRHIVLFVFAFFLLTAPAYAAPAINAEGAAKLKKEVEETLSFHKKMADTMKQGISLTGDVEVTPKGNAYEVKLPGLAVVSAEEKLDIGTLIINAVPGDKGEYVTTFALPSPMTVRDDKGVAQVEATLGQQKISGTWWPALGTYTQMNTEFGNVAVKGLTSENNFNIAIASLKSTIDLKQNPDNTWSGPQVAEATGITIDTPATAETGARKLSIANLGGQAIYDKMDLAAANVLRQKFEAIFKDGKKPSQEDINKAVLDIYKNQKTLFDGVSSDFMLINLAYEAVPGPKDAPDTKPTLIKVEKFSSLAEARGMMQPKSRGGIKMSLKGLSVPNVPADVLAVIPTEFNLETNVAEIPALEISKIMAEMTVLSSTPPENNKAALLRQQKMTELSNSMGKLLAAAGSYLTVNNTYFNAPELRMTLAGKITAKEGVPPKAFGSEGGLTLNVEGMDELILKKPTAVDPKDQSKQFLSVFQMMGQPGKTADGKSLRTYKLETMPDGRILLNNADISMFSALLGGLKAAPATGGAPAQSPVAPKQAPAPTPAPAPAP